MANANNRASERELAVIHKSFQASLTIAVASTWEAECALLLGNELSNFVFAAEGATVDCGLLITGESEFHTATGHTQRLVETIQRHGDEEVLIALDCKTCLPRHVAPWKGGQYFHAISVQPEQHRCAAFLVFSPLAPHLVAIIPRHYMNLDSDDCEVYYNQETPLSGIKLEPFPARYCPFVMPITRAGEAIGSLFAFANNSDIKWCNPHTNITFSDIPPLSLQPVSLLLSAEDSSLRDFPMISRLWSALQRFSARFKLERMMIEPSVGDFIIFDTLTQERAVFEIKFGSLTIQKHSNILVIDSRSSKGIRYFSHMVKWHFLVTTNKADDAIISVFGVNDLPEYLFSSETQTSTDAHWYDVNLDWLQQHQHRWTADGDEALVSWFDNLIGDYHARGEFNPLVNKPYCKLPIDALDEHDPKLVERVNNAAADVDAPVQPLYYLCDELDEEDGVKDTVPRSRPSQDSISVGAAEPSRSHEASMPPGHERDVLTTVVAGRRDIPETGTQNPVDRKSRVRGGGPKWSPILWESRIEAYFLLQIETRGLGCLVRLDLHPSAKFAYNPFCDPKATLFDLDMRMPLLLLNFAQLNFIDRRIPTDNRRARPLIRATHGLSESLYVVFNDHYVDDMLNCFVIPSAQLYTDERSEFNQTLQNKGYHDTTNATSLVLRDSEPLENYGVRLRDLESFINCIASQQALPERYSTHPLANRRLKEIVFTQEVVRQSFRLTQNPSKWNDGGILESVFNK